MASVAKQQERGFTPARKKVARRGMRWWEWIGAFFGVLISLVLVAATGGAIYGARLVQETADSLGSFDQLVEYRPGGITEIYATDKDPKTGQPILLGKVYGQYREFVPINKIPDVIKFATIAIEDERFYEHVGVDLQGIARAVYKNYVSGHMGEGASTLTQQLARNLILKSTKKTLDRKLKEAVLSVQIERNFSKEQILEMYLNEVCYGANAFGIQAAARVYFNKSLDKLTMSEAALLAGLPQRPNSYEPFRHYDYKKSRWKADKEYTTKEAGLKEYSPIDRRDLVLAKMLEVKAKDAKREDHLIAKNLNLKAVTQEAVTKARKESPKLQPEPDPANAQFKAPLFTNYALKQVIKRLGKEAVYSGGLKIYTTLNYEMQQQAELSLIKGVKEVRGDGVTEGALVSIEPRSGYIRAMVGSVDGKNKFNNATQGRRQPGSSFKVFVYTAAFASGKYGPNSYVDDKPFKRGRWTPKNYGGNYHGTVSILTAFEHSFNIPAVVVAEQTGIGNILNMAGRMGVDAEYIRKRHGTNLALALGAGEVTPLEMASAYSTFPNRGDHAEAIAVYRVVDQDGNDVPGFGPKVEKGVVPPGVVADMGTMMRAVVTSGTARGDATEVPGACGKTGTTNDNRDAWFVGYTPELSTSVWVCGVRKDKKTGRLYYPQMAGTGGKICAPIWARFMKLAVPIQQRYANTNRVLPEQVIPRNADIAARLNTPQPKPSEGPSTAAQAPVPSDPTPTAAPPSEALEIPRATTDPDTDESDSGVKPVSNLPIAEPDGNRNSGGDGGTTPEASGPAVNISNAPTSTATPSAPAVTRSPRSPRAVPASGRGADKSITVEVCADSGGRATKWCPSSVTKTFPAGQGPRGSCPIHKPKPGDG